MLDGRALCTCRVVAGAKLVRKGAGSGAPPVWVAQLAPLALSPYGCPLPYFVANLAGMCLSPSTL